MGFYGNQFFKKKLTIVLIVVSVDGGYSDWSNDSSCSVTCGGGTLERRRTCDNPPPSHGGKTCVEGGLGPDVETHACNSDPCPLHAGHKE